VERATAGFGPERPQAMTRVVNERHRERLCRGTELDRGRIGNTERYTAVGTAQAFRFREPSGDALELRDRNAGAREDHNALR
jgi:hypothetical protein